VLVLASYGTFVLNTRGVDPLLAGAMLTPVFLAGGVLFYRFYHSVFERRAMRDAVAGEAGLRAIAFFVGLAFVIEVGLSLTFGVDQRLVSAGYIGRSLSLGEFRVPTRLLVAFGAAVTVTLLLMAFMSRTFIGRAIRAVAQNQYGLELVGADPVTVKQWAFGIATAVAALSGALLIVAGPVDPSYGRVYIGKAFSIVVLGGLGSMAGTLPAAMILGVTESMVLTYFGASWAPAVSFAALLLVLAIKPTGLFGAKSA
jgi:branched-chain amino acid transport system permease protein